MASQFKDVADRGFSNAHLYDKHRPSYPPEAFSDLLDQLKLKGKHGARILDLGAGTGKFTELLVRCEEKYFVLAIEPQENMRKELESKNLPDVDVKPGLSYSLPVEDGSFDAVIAAQAFHWYANQPSLEEIHRVLKPGGSLGMIWNIEDYNQTRSATVGADWLSQLRDLTWTFDDESPRFRHEKWQDVFDTQLNILPAMIVGQHNAQFTLPIGKAVDKYEWFVELDKEELWNRYRTLSQVAVLEGDELKKVRAKFDDIVSGPDVDLTSAGKLRVHGATTIAWTTKLFDGAPIDSATDLES